MDLSVIIVNYNVKHFLEQCLRTVEKAMIGIDAEVFVVDNNSVDGSNGMIVLKFPWVKLIANKQNVGFAKANNQAIKQSSGRYVLLLNPDTVVEEDTFRKTIDFMDSHPEAGGLGVKMIDGCGNFLPESKRGLPTPWVAFYKIFGLSRLFPKSKRFGRYHLSYLSQNEIHKIDVLSGAYMFLRRETLDKVGFLDEDYFMYGEDIDLSYRITQGGYENYYFPGTTIIHYKGESTKKGSLNYVRMFYNAMIIFANKHFSQQYAGRFSFFIKSAIYFRAALAAVSRLLMKLWLPLLDAVLLLLGFRMLLIYWGNLRYEPGYYFENFVAYSLAGYVFSLIVAIYYSGGYEKPVSLLNILKGVACGSVFILVVYSLLPETLRFSRAIILMGTLMSALLLLTIRLILHFVVGKSFKLGVEKPKRVAIVGMTQECERVGKMLGQSGRRFEIVGNISPVADFVADGYIGNVEQMQEIVRINQINELIFCAEDISSHRVIKMMLGLTSFKLEYKIAPTQSVSIIGSNSIETSGDLYIVNDNNISDENNRRNKRLLDFLVSIFLLLTFLVSMWFVKSKSGLWKNIFSVMIGNKSWVGYCVVSSEAYLGLPVIKAGVVECSTQSENLDNTQLDHINVDYARDYKVTHDIETIWKSFKNLGRR